MEKNTTNKVEKNLMEWNGKRMEMEWKVNANEMKMKLKQKGNEMRKASKLDAEGPKIQVIIYCIIINPAPQPLGKYG